MSEESKEINIQKLKNEYPGFFKKMPSKVIEFILSEKTLSQITEICMKNEVKDEEKIEGVARRIVWILFKKLPQESLSITFEKGLGLKPETAQKISNETDRLIFSQAPFFEKESATKENVKKEPKKNAGIDAYKEPIE